MTDAERRRRTTAAPAEPAAHAALDVIETVEDYRAAVAAIAAGTGPVAIDAERASGFRYSQRAYLIQVFRRGAGVFLFDPPAIGIPFTELADAIGDEEWILHAASQDLACLREVGLDPARIFDTELGARLAGLPRVGLGAVVEELLGIHLAKEHSAADWSTRPLPQSWLVYAALDVELLPELRDKVADLLENAGKREIARQEFDAVLAARDRRCARTRGAGSRACTACARRATSPSRANSGRPATTTPARSTPRPVASCPTARSSPPRAPCPPTKRDLAAIKEFTGRASRSQLDRWFDAIQRGMTTDDLPAVRPPTDTLPPPRVWADKNPEADGRFKRARADVTGDGRGARHPAREPAHPRVPAPRGLDAARPDHRRDASATRSRTLGARPWQVDAIAQVIADAFVRIDQTPDEPTRTPLRRFSQTIRGAQTPCLGWRHG